MIPVKTNRAKNQRLENRCTAIDNVAFQSAMYSKFTEEKISNVDASSSALIQQPNILYVLLSCRFVC